MKQEQSSRTFQEAQRYIPGGVNSPVRSFASVDQTPVFVKQAKGAYLYDEDDQCYLDYINSWGPMILGHSHPLLNQCLIDVVDKGMSYGLPTTIEVTLAKQIVDAYPGMDMVRMVNSGTEATMSAIRVARGYRGKDKIIKFEGCYHGHSDGLLVKSGSGTLTFATPTSPGVPQDVVKNTFVCRYNDIASVEAMFAQHKDEIACVIIEPIAGNMGLIPAQKTFLQQLRNLCTKEKALLIFDEVISGFRCCYQGAAHLYDVTPDMACFGKIIGGGLPVGAYAGKRDIMSLVSPIGPIYQAGTLSGNPLAMHVGSTLLHYLQANPQLYTQLEEKGKYLEDGMKKILAYYKLPYQVVRSGSLLTLFFMDFIPQNYDDVVHCDTAMYALYFKGMLERGILIAPSQFEAMFLSDAHTMEDLQHTLVVFEDVMKELAHA